MSRYLLYVGLGLVYVSLILWLISGAHCSTTSPC
jgi:hypothetical protein